jgi:5-methylcytosine-specific restriction endonuclease McrA
MVEYKKEELEKLILVDKLSFEKIGRMYGVSGAAVKNAAKRRGIAIPPRRKINEKETFGRGRTKYKIGVCIECGKEFVKYPQKSNLFCSQKCQCEHLYKENVSKWKSGEISGYSRRYKLSGFVKRYLFEKANYCCEECGCSLTNKYTSNSILQIHHKDGNAANAKEENLEVICPNCHAMTENFGSRNKNSVRNYRKDDYKKLGY